MHVNPNETDQWYGFVWGPASEGYLEQVLASHPDVCPIWAKFDLQRTLEDIVECGERYTLEEVVESALSAGWRTVEECEGCYCGRYQEVDGVVINGDTLCDHPRPDPRALYRSYSPRWAVRIIELITARRMEQGEELHKALLPLEADRWFEALTDAQRGFLDDYRFQPREVA